VVAFACHIARIHWAFARQRVREAVDRPCSSSNSTIMPFSKVLHLPSLLMLSNPASSLTLTRGRQDATCRTRLLRSRPTIMRRHLHRHASSRRRLRPPSTAPSVIPRRHFHELTPGMASLRPTLNRRCQVSRRSVSRLLHTNIQIYPNKPAPSCKIITLPSPIVPYRHLLILYRGRRAVEDPHSTRSDTHQTSTYVLTTHGTSSSDRILTYVFQMIWTRHTPVLTHFCTVVPSSHTINIYIQLIFLCLLRS